VSVAAELNALYKRKGGLEPLIVVRWAESHPESALHGQFQWDDTSAAHAYRLWQARELITHVEVEYPDGKVRQVYVSPMPNRGNIGYVALVDVLSNKGKREQFLAQALAEYERLGERYRDLRELAGVRRAVANIRRKRRSG
jgi:hypothetical protein